MLNNDVEDGLDPEFNTEAHLDLVTPPVVKAGGGNKMTFVTELESNEPSVPITEEALFGPNLEAGKLPNFDAEFQIIEQNRVKVIDLKEIEAEISRKDVVSQEDVSMVDAVFGQFFGQRLSKEEFTKAPSKTGLRQTKSFLKLRIAKEEQQLLTQLAGYFATPMQDLDTFVKHVQETFVPAARDQVLTFQAQYQNVLENVLTSKNTVLPLGAEPYSVNVLNVPIEGLVIEQIPTMLQALSDEDKVAGQEMLHKALQALQALLCPRFSHFLLSAIDGHPELSVNQEFLFTEEKLTIGHLVILYQGTTFLASLDYLEQTVSEALKKFKTLMEKMEETEQDFEHLNQYIVKHTEEILQQTKLLTHGYSLARNLTLLNVSVQYVLNFLRFCL